MCSKMILRKAEEYILILVVIRTCYSLNEKQCSNAYTSCAQGLGVCKPECKMGEDRLGSCHGSGCSCCKIIKPGVDWKDDILTNDVSKYNSGDFWLSKSYNLVGNEEKGAKNDQGYLKGKGRVTEQNEETYVKGKGCEYEGNLYADGAIWTVDCMEHTCNGGQLGSKLSPNCCEFEDHKYCDGDTWSRFCTVYTCNHGQVDTKDDEKCCEDDGKKYLSGDSWTEGCFEIVCHMGMIEEKQLASCCQANEVLYESGQTWTEECDHFKCNNGMIERSDSLTCCSGPDGVMKPSGETWLEGCIKKTCFEGTIKEETATDLCCPGPDGVMKPSGETWLEGCIKKTCFEGTIKEETATDLCCPGPNGVMKPSGETWLEGCINKTCLEGNIKEETALDLCCVDNFTAYKEFETVFKNECEIHACKCTKDGCSFVLTDDSQCEIETTTPQVTTEGHLFDETPPQIIEKCRYNNTWMEDGAQLTEGCFEITCQRGCTCWEKLQHGCCYNDETEHKNEGETWEENCIVHTCANGNITEKESLRSECTPKEEGCMYGGKVYLDGDIINYGCTIHQCKSSKFISYPNPTCCVVDGHEYPSGSEWEEECYTSCCEMGLVKKIAKGTCNNCQGAQGCQENVYFQFQQTQPCQFCCTVGITVYQNGQTWMDNCNTHMCNQGRISTTVMPNCG